MTSCSAQAGRLVPGERVEPRIDVVAQLAAQRGSEWLGQVGPRAEHEGAAARRSTISAAEGMPCAAGMSWSGDCRKRGHLVGP